MDDLLRSALRAAYDGVASPSDDVTGIAARAQHLRRRRAAVHVGLVASAVSVAATLVPSSDDSRLGITVATPAPVVRATGTPVPPSAPARHAADEFAALAPAAPTARHADERAGSPAAIPLPQPAETRPPSADVTRNREPGVCHDDANPASGEPCLAAESDAAGKSVTMSVTVCRAVAGPEVVLSYPTTQEVDFAVHTAAGRPVWRWSAGRRFPADRHELRLGTGDCLRWSTTWTAPGPGQYRVIATSSAAQLRSQSATTGFEVR